MKRHSHKWIINNLDKAEVIEMDFRKLEAELTRYKTALHQRNEELYNSSVTKHELKEELKETNKNWTDTITYYEKRLAGARQMVLDLRKKTPKSIAKGTLFLISELLRSEKKSLNANQEKSIH
jgi:hypothetical protein